MSRRSATRSPPRAPLWLSPKRFTPQRSKTWAAFCRRREARTAQGGIVTATPDSASIVVGVDDSTGSRAALSWAADEASRRGAPLALVYAWRPMYQSEADPLGHTDAGAV